jgi:hypothetical protein
MHGPALYEIRLQGRLSARWVAWFEGMAVVANPDGTTLLSGVLADQAALHGLLAQIRDLGLPLLAVARVGDADRLGNSCRQDGAGPG